MRTYDETDRQEPQDESPSNIPNNDDEGVISPRGSASQAGAPSRPYLQRGRMASSKRFGAGNRRDVLQKYTSAFGRSVRNQVISEDTDHKSWTPSEDEQPLQEWGEASISPQEWGKANMDAMNDSTLLSFQDSFRPDGSVTSAVVDARRTLLRKTAFLSMDDSQPVLLQRDDDDDDLLHELEDLTDAQKELEDEMDAANRMFPEMGQPNFDGNASEIDMSWADSSVAEHKIQTNAGYKKSKVPERLIPRLSSIQSVGTYHEEDNMNSSAVVLSSSQLSSDDDENSITVDDLLVGDNLSSVSQTLSTEEDNFTGMNEVPSDDDQGNDLQSEPSVNDPKNQQQEAEHLPSTVLTACARVKPITVQELTPSQSYQNINGSNSNNKNEDIESNAGEPSNVVGHIAFGIFDGHEYKVNLFWKDKMGKPIELTRTYEGSLLVHLASCVFISFFHGKIPHNIFWSITAIVPPAVTIVEINLPHRTDEAVVALGILSCHFVLSKCVTLMET